jgi:hypothetical protein
VKEHVVTLKHEFYVECNQCGEPAGDAGTPVPAPWPTAQEAIDRAVENGWLHDPETGRLLCQSCRPDDQHDDPDDLEQTAG